MGDMSTMGGGGGGPAPCQFRFRASTAQGPYSVKEQDTRHPKMLSPESSRLPRCYPGESSEVRLARTEGRLTCLNIIDECTGEAVEEAAKGCIREVSDFVAGWRFRDWGSMAKDGMGGGMGESDLVPLAIVDAGLQQCDRSSAVEHIKRGLERGPAGSRGSGGPAGSAYARRRPQVVAVLRGQDCVTIQAALAQITRQCHMIGGTRSRRPLFMDALEEWYNSCPCPKTRLCPASDPVYVGAGPEEVEGEEMGDDEAVAAAAAAAATGAGADAGESVKVGRVEAAAAAARRQRGPVVVLLEDVEGFDKQVLRDLMNVLAQPPCERKRAIWRQPRAAAAVAADADATRFGRPIPIALVAIASARVGFPTDRLAPSAARQLHAEHFHFPSSLECVEVLYDKLFIQRRLPFCMGGRLLSWMRTTFNDAHLSVGTLSKQVKMEASFHFSRPASYLCLQHCRPWLRSSLVGNCPEDTMKHLKYKLVRDSRMPVDRLRAALPGVPPNLGPAQAVGLIEQGLRREASRALRLWFFHKVWKVLLKSLEERETTLGELKLAETILGRPRAHAAATGMTSPAGFRGSKRVAELGSPMRIVALLSLPKKSKRYFAELAEVSRALTHLVPVEVEALLRDLIAALPSSAPSASANHGAAPPAAATNQSRTPQPTGPSVDESAAPPAGDDKNKHEKEKEKEKAIVNQEEEEKSRDQDQDGMVSPATHQTAAPEAGAGTGPGVEAGVGVASPRVPGGGGGNEGDAGPTRYDSDTDIDGGFDSTRPSEPRRASDSQAQAHAVRAAAAAATTTTAAAAATAPGCLGGLDPAEASYLKRGAQRVLRLWLKADLEGWAEPDENMVQWSLASSHQGFGGGAAAVGGSGGGPRGGLGAGGGGGGKSTGSRGSRLFNSALHQSSAGDGGTSSRRQQQQQPVTASSQAARRESLADAAAEGSAVGRSSSPLHLNPNPRLPVSVAGDEGLGSAPVEEEDLDGQRTQALRRACLVKELQLLFLHVMGAARGEPLGPGIDHPPTLADHSSVLSEVHCCDDGDREALESSLCPLTRTSVDVGMMEGACKGTSSVVQKRKEMSEEQPVLDICLLYACYRGHGKTIDRSDWFADFRSETLKHKKRGKNASNHDSSNKTKASKGTNSTINKAAAGRSKSPGGGNAGAGSGSRGGGDVDPAGSAELLARFEHASDQLASMGYVRPLKRRKKLEERRSRRGGEAPGPKGAVTRLVFSYTMEDGAL